MLHWLSVLVMGLGSVLLGFGFGAWWARAPHREAEPLSMDVFLEQHGYPLDWSDEEWAQWHALEIR